MSHMNGNYADLEAIFIALDLNNIPLLDVMNEESVALFLEHHKVASQLQEVLLEQAIVKSQLADIAEQLKSIRAERKLELPKTKSCKPPSPTGRPQSSPTQSSYAFTPVKKMYRTDYFVSY